MLFPAKEYQDRAERAQALMARDGLDALILADQPNFDYFAGFDVQHPWTSRTRSLVLLLPRRGDPLLLLPAFLAEEAPYETWVRDVRPYTRIDRFDAELLLEALRERDLHRGRIGLELGQEQRVNLSPRDFERVREGLAGAELADAAPLLWELRRIKSPLELAALRRACRATDAALLALLSGGREGWSELQAVNLAVRTALEHGADWPGFVAVTSGPGSYHRSLGRPRDRRLERGDMLWMDLGVRASGYWSDYCRAGVVGGPSPEQERLQGAILAATRAGVAAIKPGAAVADVARAALSVCEAQGIRVHSAGRVGHGIGLSSTEPPHVAAFDPTILQAGMVITVEPTYTDRTGIYCIEEIVAVTRDGHEVLSGAPRELATI